MVFDTTREEQEAQEARLTVSIDQDGQVVAMQKGGTNSFTSDEISQAMNKVKDKTKEFRSLIDKSVE